MFMRWVLIVVLCASFIFCGVIAYLALQYDIPEDRAVLSTYGQCTASRLPKLLSILVWNVHKGSDAGWQEDLVRLSEGASLVLLQEAFLGQKMQNLFESSLNKKWAYARSFGYPSLEATTGVALGSAAQAQEISFHRSPGREPLLRTPKMAVSALYALEGAEEPLLVVNVHAQLATSYAWYEAQLRSLAELIAAHKGPVIWAGDFNTWTRARLELLESLAVELELLAVSFVPDGRTTFWGRPLDHIFIRGFDVVSSQVHGELQSSDHKALSCVLRLR